MIFRRNASIPLQDWPPLLVNVMLAVIAATVLNASVDPDPPADGIELPAAAPIMMLFAVTGVTPFTLPGQGPFYLQ
jgi:hypothetical protein